MKEVISIHVGDGGIRMGKEIQELFAIEAGINQKGGLESKNPNSIVNSFFSQSSKGLVSRSAFVGSDDDALFEVNQSTHSAIFDKSHQALGKESTGHNFGRARYGSGKQIPYEQVIRKLAENCNQLQGFMVYAGVGGGCGSGTTANVLEFLNTNFANKTKIGLVVLPSENAAYHTSAVENYNAILSLPSLKKLDLIIPVLNSSVHDQVRTNGDVSRPDYQNINRVLAQFISGVTTQIRFQGSSQSYSSLNDFTRLNQSVKYVAGTISGFGAKFADQNEDDLAGSMIQGAHQISLSKNGVFHGKSAAGLLMYRGKVNQTSVTKAVNYLNKDFSKRQGHDVNVEAVINNKENDDWIGSTHYKHAVSSVSLRPSSALAENFSRIDHRFDLLYAKRAFVHWYVGEGMEEGEFSEAREETAALSKTFEDLFATHENE